MAADPIRPRHDSGRRTGRRARRWTLGTAALLVVGGAVAGGLLLTGDSGPRSDTCTSVGTGDDADRTFTYTPDQVENAASIASVAMRRDLPRRAITIALATALQESRLHNLDHGDRDSKGLFQQRPSQGWGSDTQVQDPEYAAGKFFDALVKVPNWQQMPLTEAAQAVQRSGLPNAYARWEPRATSLSGALAGEQPATLWCRLRHVPTPPGADQLTARLKHDLPAGYTVGVSPDGRTVTVSGLTPGGSALLRPWTVASWAVAHSADMGIVQVSVDGHRWKVKDKGWDAGHDTPPGTVTIRLGDLATAR